MELKVANNVEFQNLNQRIGEVIEGKKKTDKIIGEVKKKTDEIIEEQEKKIDNISNSLDEISQILRHMNVKSSSA